MIVDLLRHGETSADGSTGRGVLRGRRDDALTPAGWAQMQAATDAPRGAWEIVVSSPLRRCAEFARDFATKQGLPLEVDARLAELDFGAWEGVAIDSLMQSAAGAEALRLFWADPWRHPPPQGEPLAAFELRVRAAWQDLGARHAGRHILLVTHGGVIRLLLCAARGRSRCELLEAAVAHGSLHRLANVMLREIPANTDAPGAA